MGRRIHEIYTGTYKARRVGDGTTMDAIRSELATGQQVGGRWHLEKGFNAARGLDNWLAASVGAVERDRQIAASLLDELMGLFE
jgi:hypothetical protein